MNRTPRLALAARLPSFKTIFTRKKLFAGSEIIEFVKFLSRVAFWIFTPARRGRFYCLKEIRKRRQLFRTDRPRLLLWKFLSAYSNRRRWWVFFFAFFYELMLFFFIRRPQRANHSHANDVIFYDDFNFWRFLGLNFYFFPICILDGGANIMADWYGKYIFALKQ